MKKIIMLLTALIALASCQNSSNNVSSSEPRKPIRSMWINESTGFSLDLTNLYSGNYTVDTYPQGTFISFEGLTVYHYGKEEIPALSNYPIWTTGNVYYTSALVDSYSHRAVMILSGNNNAVLEIEMTILGDDTLRVCIKNSCNIYK